MNVDVSWSIGGLGSSLDVCHVVDTIEGELVTNKRKCVYGRFCLSLGILCKCELHLVLYYRLESMFQFQFHCHAPHFMKLRCLLLAI